MAEAHPSHSTCHSGSSCGLLPAQPAEGAPLLDIAAQRTGLNWLPTVYCQGCYTLGCCCRIHGSC